MNMRIVDNKNIFVLEEHGKVVSTVIIYDFDNDYENNLELLKEIKSLPYKLGDDNILKGELQYIKTMLKPINRPSYEEFCKIFNEFNFNNTDISDNISYELTLLKKYIIAKNNFFKRNIRLVYSISRHFNNVSKMQFNDIIQEGNFGLIKAINTFNPDKNIKLATYASRCIENEILMYLRRNNKTKMEVSIDEPLNVDWDGNELLLSDILGTEEDIIYRDIESEVERKLLNKAIGKLTPREKTIVELRFGLNNKEGNEMTQKEVADFLGISQSYISRLEKKIISRLKKEIVRFE